MAGWWRAQVAESLRAGVGMPDLGSARWKRTATCCEWDETVATVSLRGGHHTEGSLSLSGVVLSNNISPDGRTGRHVRDPIRHGVGWRRRQMGKTSGATKSRNMKQTGINNNAGLDGQDGFTWTGISYKMHRG